MQFCFFYADLFEYAKLQKTNIQNDELDNLKL